MKKLLITLLLAIAFVAQAELTLTTNVAAGTWVLLSSRAHVSTVTVIGTNNVTVRLYDQNTLADPYYGTNVVIPEYVSRSSYPTNIVNTFIGYQGLTNSYTNTGIFSYYVTNSASTNVLQVSAALSGSATAPVTYSGDWLFSRGVVISGESGFGVTITYQP